MGRWLVLFCGVLCILARGSLASETVMVYAAASLTSALQELAQRAEKHDLPLRLSFGGSSVLAKQIAQGAPADIFISANVNWVDFLSEQGLIEDDTRVSLLTNALVIIAPQNETFHISVRPDFDFPKAFSGRLALGDPSHVPAGIYARQALEHLGWWLALKNRIAPATDVRGALALVGRAECPVGIVYATDAAISQKVTTIAVLPDALHTPIQYPIAVIKNRQSAQTDAVMNFLQSAEATAVFRRYGFLAPRASPKNAE